MKIAAWNVNSLNVRLPRLLAWLEKQAPDIVCLQETKCENVRFPQDILLDAGYQSCFHGQKTYNGVAILARRDMAMSEVGCGIDDYDDPQARVIAATVDKIRAVCVYVPNGQAVGSEKFEYKMQWCRHLRRYLQEALMQHPELVVAGDFNIAPDDRDVCDPDIWRGQILCSDEERVTFRSFLSLGLVDSFRLFKQPPNVFSWWDYRQLGFIKNRGLRIDHLLISEALRSQCISSTIDRDERKGEKPSDHAPAVAEFRDRRSALLF
ncbi:MAG: exodeoxyribonuclease III [Burkholderiales bacterium]|jgi:exodeoxyribonuclease-3|nr:exodeoxyribonuclease III [Burkholderiales bacterium]